MLLRANEPVPRDVLVHELWGERPPASARGSLEVYVSRLRKALGTAGNGHVVVTRPGGYCLQLADGQLDMYRFERLVAQGRSALAGNAPEQAEANLRAALRLWRRNALGDLSCEAFAQVEAGRLEELRLGAVEDRIEADLALGRHADLVSELEALVATHPLRERLQGQLMIALYRCGRQAEALEAYQVARRMLVGELSLEPGPALQRLERAILRQDPLLELPGPVMAGPTRLWLAQIIYSRAARATDQEPRSACRTAGTCAPTAGPIPPSAALLHPASAGLTSALRRAMARACDHGCDQDGVRRDRTGGTGGDCAALRPRSPAMSGNRLDGLGRRSACS